MKLYYDRRSKDPTYFIQHGFRNGKKTSTRNVRRIGKHSELLLITDDPLAYAKEEVRKYNEDYKAGKIELSLPIDFQEKLADSGNIASKSKHVNIGYFILQHLYHDLDIPSFVKEILDDTKATFHGNDVHRFITFGRVLDPKSKLGTWDDLENYYEQPAFSYQHILRYMDILAPHFDEYIEHLYNHSLNIVKRNTAVCYFDCSNFYFEIEEADEDYIDPVTGEIMTGLRQYGISKQHQPAPLVGMGLFMDADGIPISMCITPGNQNEQLCAVPLERQLVHMTEGKPFIYCADAGLGSYNIRKFNEMGGRAFIVTQSVKKLSQTLKTAVFNDFDYRRLSDDEPMTIADMKTFDCHEEKNRKLYDDKVYKVLEAGHAMDTGLFEEKVCKNGKIKMVKCKAELKQHVIITFSRKMMEYQRHIRNRQIERAEFKLKNSTVEEMKKGNHDVKRFIKRTSTGKDGEPAIDHYSIDRDKITEEEKYDGYYAVATNLDDDVKSILEINAKRYQIEDCFRIMKTNLGGRPAYHHLPNRITAHFLFCYTALLIYRLLEKQLDKLGHHFTINQIIDTLKNMNIIDINGEFYASDYTSSKVCTAFNELYGLGLDKKYYLPADLNKKLKKMK